MPNFIFLRKWRQWRSVTRTLPFSIAITSLGEERANLGAFRTFVRFVLVWICQFPLPLGVWEGLRFVVVALPGLSSYLFLHCYIYLDKTKCQLIFGHLGHIFKVVKGNWIEIFYQKQFTFIIIIIIIIICPY